MSKVSLSIVSKLPHYPLVVAVTVVVLAVVTYLPAKLLTMHILFNYLEASDVAKSF